MKKNIIIDGDRFQKEYKNQYIKELITDLMQGIIFLIISCSGLFLGDKLLLNIVIYIVPIFILIYAVNLFSMGLTIFKKEKKKSISFFVQALVFAVFAVYIFLNPIKSLNYVLIIIGACVITNAIIKAIYFPNYFPVGSFIFGGLLILFSETLINFFYTIVMFFLLMFGIAKISKFIYSFRNK